MSSQRTAKPSMALLSQGGLSRSTMMSSPNTRPSASSIEIFSKPRLGVPSRTIFCASSSADNPCAASFAFIVYSRLLNKSLISSAQPRRAKRRPSPNGTLLLVRSASTSTQPFFRNHSMLILRSNVHQRPALLAKCFDVVRDLVIGLSSLRVRAEHGKWLARVRLRDDIGIERNPAQKGHTHVLRRGFPSALAEHFNMVMAMRAF